MHRGPQAHATPQSQTLIPSYGGYAPQFHAPNAALLIDFDNVTMGIRSDLGNELRNLLSSDIIKGRSPSSALMSIGAAIRSTSFRSPSRRST